MADNFYIILNGDIGLYNNIQNPDDNSNWSIREIAKLTAGDSFGELGLLFDETRNATAICLSHTQLLVLKK